MEELEETGVVRLAEARVEAARALVRVVANVVVANTATPAPRPPLQHPSLRSR